MRAEVDDLERPQIEEFLAGGTVTIRSTLIQSPALDISGSRLAQKWSPDEDVVSPR